MSEAEIDVIHCPIHGVDRFTACPPAQVIPLIDFLQSNVPVLETLGSDELRLSIAQRVARETESPPLEIVPDLIASALARRDLNEAIRLLESQKDRGAFGVHEAVLLVYLYCLNANVDKAEALAVANSALINQDSSADWLWKKLETDFGFHPPY